MNMLSESLFFPLRQSLNFPGCPLWSLSTTEFPEGQSTFPLGSQPPNDGVCGEPTDFLEPKSMVTLLLCNEYPGRDQHWVENHCGKYGKNL